MGGGGRGVAGAAGQRSRHSLLAWPSPTGDRRGLDVKQNRRALCAAAAYGVRGYRRWGLIGAGVGQAVLALFLCVLVGREADAGGLATGL